MRAGGRGAVGARQDVAVGGGERDAFHPERRVVDCHHHAIQAAEAAAHRRRRGDAAHDVEDQLRGRAAQRQVFGGSVGELLVFEQQRGLVPAERRHQHLVDVERERLLEARRVDQVQLPQHRGEAPAVLAHDRRAPAPGPRARSGRAGPASPQAPPLVARGAAHELAVHGAEADGRALAVSHMEQPRALADDTPLSGTPAGAGRECPCLWSSIIVAAEAALIRDSREQDVCRRRASLASD